MAELRLEAMSAGSFVGSQVRGWRWCHYGALPYSPDSRYALAHRDWTSVRTCLYTNEMLIRGGVSSLPQLFISVVFSRAMPRHTPNTPTMHLIQLDRYFLSNLAIMLIQLDIHESASAADGELVPSETLSVRSIGGVSATGMEPAPAPSGVADAGPGDVVDEGGMSCLRGNIPS
jgi:hypothetical protein